MSGSHHGFVRGANLARESRMFEGRFGRMFRSLPALDLDPADEEVGDLAFAMARVRPKLPAVGDEYEGIMAAAEVGGPTAETAPDGEEGVIPSGYTYLGQFIDHDLTFDPASSLQRQNDPEALINFRTPRFDLDSVYGRGPDDQPYMYEMVRGDFKLFLLGDKINGPDGNAGPPRHTDLDAVDHMRAKANASGARRALIGDKRNDENTIVAQLHTVFQRFHNRYALQHPHMTFEEVQRDVRWHYQWVVLHDYLIRICGKPMVHSILPHLASGKSIFVDKPALRHYSFDNDPFIPTEFSAAAFRFGHSMVRPVYRLSRGFDEIPGLNKPEGIVDQNLPANSRRMVFDFTRRNLGLNGFDAIPTGWAIEWDLFFGNLADKALTFERVQPAYKVDPSLVNPLAALPEFLGEARVSNLAYRNLLRGFAMKLPSGEDVARAMGEAELPPEWLVIGKAEISAAQATTPQGIAEAAATYKKSKRIASFKLPKSKTAPFVDATPLWLYILCEGARNVFESKPYALGPVGGRIVAETMIGILLGDKRSYLIQDPNWTPMGGTGFDMLAFVNYATNKPT